MLHYLVREFLRRVDVPQWDAATSEVYESGRAATPSGGRVLAPLDLLICSQAVGFGAVLVSSDRAFGQLPGLRVEDWLEEPR